MKPFGFHLKGCNLNGLVVKIGLKAVGNFLPHFKMEAEGINWVTTNGMEWISSFKGLGKPHFNARYQPQNLGPIRIKGPSPEICDFCFRTKLFCNFSYLNIKG